MCIPLPDIIQRKWREPKWFLGWEKRDENDDTQLGLTTCISYFLFFQFPFRLSFSGSLLVFLVWIKKSASEHQPQQRRKVCSESTTVLHCSPFLHSSLKKSVGSFCLTVTSRRIQKRVMQQIHKRREKIDPYMFVLFWQNFFSSWFPCKVYIIRSMYMFQTCK